MRGKHYIARSAKCFFFLKKTLKHAESTSHTSARAQQHTASAHSCFLLRASCRSRRSSSALAQRSAGQQPARGSYKTSGGLYSSALLSLGCSYLARLSLSAFSDFLFFSSSPFVFFSFIRLKANRYDFFSRNHSIESINSSLLLQLVACPLVRSFSPSSLQSLSLPLSL